MILNSLQLTIAHRLFSAYLLAYATAHDHYKPTAPKPAPVPVAITRLAN